VKKRILYSFLLPFVFLTISGCLGALIIGGAAGALGAYAISKDTIQGDTDKPYDSLWDAASRVSKIRGSIKQEDSAQGYIELEAEQSKVDIRLIRLTRANTRLRIKARNKLHLPNLDLAQDIFVKIMEEAR
jgi:hypothetical protein